MNKDEHTAAILAHLREEGYVPKLDDDGDIVFKMEGKMYWVMLNENDQEFLRIVHPNFWSIEDEEERARVERACLETTAELKVVKVIPFEDDTWASMELFSSSIENTKQILPRALGTLATSVHTFLRKMRG